MSDTLAQNDDQPMKHLNGAADPDSALDTEALAAKAKDTAKHLQDEAQRMAQTGLETANAQLTTASEEITSTIRRNPAASVGIALGAGVLLGLLLRGRS